MFTNCAGVIVFDNNNTILCRTDLGNHSFPKGKKDGMERMEQTAFRELYEETGIKPKDIIIVTNTILDEVNEDSGMISVQYLIGKYIGDKKCKFKYDTDELNNVAWYSISDATKIDKFYQRRKNILKNAYDIIDAVPDTAFIRGDILLDNVNKIPRTTTEIIKLSKTLSWILRHNVNNLKLNMSADGFINLDDILSLKQLQGINYDDIDKVVKTNDKQRFELISQTNNMFIRATQGHSNSVGKYIDDNKLLQEIKHPYPICVHGTYRKAYEIIKKNGLNIMNRKHIHFASSLDAQSGMRANVTIKIYIDMKKALADNIKFYKSSNGVILSSGINGIISPKYFSKVEQR